MKQFFQNANAQTRTLAMAGGGAIIAAAVTMFLPRALLEGITGATGLSELFPSTAAPLGDTARALIAFGTGVLTFAILAILLSKKNGQVPKMAETTVTKDVPHVFESPKSVSYETASADPAGVSLIGQLRGKVVDMFARVRGKGEITDLADLPKLRNRDIHPDAPARRPISANRDIDGLGSELVAAVPTVDMPYVQTVPAPVAVEQPAAIALAAAEPAFVSPIGENSVAEINVAETPIAKSPHAEPTAVVSDQTSHSEPASLAAMVDHLEAVLAARKAQLEHLEDIARRAVAESAARDSIAISSSEVMANPEAQAVDHQYDDQPASERRLEVVEPTGDALSRPRNGDDALRSALETLHRMNARSN
jgi:hypothetical protein